MIPFIAPCMSCSAMEGTLSLIFTEPYLQEFPARDLAYYEAAFADGRLRVAGGFVGLHDPLCNGMTIHHYIHRHEPPVLDVAIPVSPSAHQTPDADVNLDLDCQPKTSHNTSLTLLCVRKPWMCVSKTSNVTQDHRCGL